MKKFTLYILHFTPLEVAHRAAILLTGLTLLTILISCAGYIPAPQILPPHIKKIALPAFENKTIYYGIEEKFTLRVVEEFLRDGRLEITPEENADALLKGVITRYVLQPLTYSADLVVVEEYKLWVIFDLALYEKDKDEPLWEEKNLEGVYRFFAPTSNRPGAVTEEEAREMLWDILARDILRRTIYGFGTVTGASERKIPSRSE